VVRECEDSGGHILLPDIQALAHAGMTIGFHTVEHRALTELTDAELEEAVVRGRDELAAVVDSPLALFAYPHGRADGRTAEKVREAGYVGAWTGRAMPMRPGDNPYLLGRWEPGGLAVDEFVTGVSVRLIREGRTR
jgi:peptidoglycan/xylan/chitin deacetylase (PgdA/CDA1 family)